MVLFVNRGDHHGIVLTFYSPDTEMECNSPNYFRIEGKFDQDLNSRKGQEIQRRRSPGL